MVEDPAAPGQLETLTSGNLVFAGVGGQGVILASNVVSQVLLDAGFDVKKSEVHGMSQRGGTVVSHVRFGPEVHSVMVEPGSADWVVAFEWEEGLRALPYLSPDGVAFVSTERRIPPAAMLDHRSPEPAYPLRRAALPGVLAVDTIVVAGDAIAVHPAIAQTVLLGALSLLLPFPPEAWHAAISAWVPAKALEGNLTAFMRGRAMEGQVRAVWAAQSAGAEATGDVERSSAPVAGTAMHNGHGVLGKEGSPLPQYGDQMVPFVRIERSWCKGCNICVAVCPEGCLALDKADIAVFIHPERCTACSLCNLYCPDLAIDVLCVAASSAGSGVLSDAAHLKEEHV